MKINVITSDNLYGAMLCEELKERGYQTGSKADLALLDLDSGIAAPESIPVITFSRDLTADLRRPFSISELMTLIEGATLPEGRLLVTQKGASYAGEEVSLSKLEHALLLKLCEKRGEAASYSELCAALGPQGDENLLRVYIKYLRSKLDERFGVKMIATVRGVGYKLIK